jgi:hypothetical protein
MVIIILVTLLLLFLLDTARKAQVKTRELAYQYRLYALRDELREKVIQGAIDRDDWVFDFLDSSIAKSISLIHYISVYRLLVVFFVHRRDPAFHGLQKHLDYELDKPDKLCLKEIRNEFAKTIADYLGDRHWELKLLGRVAFIWITVWTNFKSLIAHQVTEYPETSTIEQFSPEAKKVIKLSFA